MTSTRSTFADAAGSLSPQFRKDTVAELRRKLVAATSAAERRKVQAEIDGLTHPKPFAKTLRRKDRSLMGIEKADHSEAWLAAHPNPKSTPKDITGHHGHHPHGPSILWPALYEHLRAKGYTKEKAARISNAAWDKHKAGVKTNTPTSVRGVVKADGPCGKFTKGDGGKCKTCGHGFVAHKVAAKVSKADRRAALRSLAKSKRVWVKPHVDAKGHRVKGFYRLDARAGREASDAAYLRQMQGTVDRQVEATSIPNPPDTKPLVRGPEPAGHPVRPLSNAEKLRNAETMYGTDSPQYRKAVRMFPVEHTGASPLAMKKPPTEHLSRSTAEKLRLPAVVPVRYDRAWSSKMDEVLNATGGKLTSDEFKAWDEKHPKEAKKIARGDSAAINQRTYDIASSRLLALGAAPPGWRPPGEGVDERSSNPLAPDPNQEAQILAGDSAFRRAEREAKAAGKPPLREADPNRSPSFIYAVADAFQSGEYDTVLAATGGDVTPEERAAWDEKNPHALKNRATEKQRAHDVAAARVASLGPAHKPAKEGEWGIVSERPATLGTGWDARAHKLNSGDHTFVIREDKLMPRDTRATMVITGPYGPKRKDGSAQELHFTSLRAAKAAAADLLAGKTIEVHGYGWPDKHRVKLGPLGPTYPANMNPAVKPTPSQIAANDARLARMDAEEADRTRRGNAAYRQVQAEKRKAKREAAKQKKTAS